MDNKAVFITLEGADGSGKTTQLKLLSIYLKKIGVNFIATRDPGGTPLGERIRDILLNYQNKIVPFGELFLYLADRAQHVDEIIVPALDNDKVVICDRYEDSTLAYQGYARGLDIDSIIELNNFATHGLKPDYTLLYDVDTETAMKRIGDKKDRLESETFDFHKRVREGYLELAKLHPERIKIIDANDDIETVHKQTIFMVNNILGIS